MRRMAREQREIKQVPEQPSAVGDSELVAAEKPRRKNIPCYSCSQLRGLKIHLGLRGLAPQYILVQQANETRVVRSSPVQLVLLALQEVVDQLFGTQQPGTNRASL